MIAMIAKGCSWVLVAAAVSCAFAALSPPAWAAQEGPSQAGETGAPDIAALCADLEQEYRNDRDRDAAAIKQALALFRKAYPDLAPPERQKVAAAVGKAFSIRPDAADREWMLAAVECLSAMEKPGLKALLAALKSPALEPVEEAAEADMAARLDAKAKIVAAIGTFKDPKTLNALFEALRSEEVRVVAAACDALAWFHDANLKQRKEIVGNLIKRYSVMTAFARKTGRYSNARSRGMADGDAIMDLAPRIKQALRALTGQDLDSCARWETWYSAHKNDKEWTPGSVEDRAETREVKAPGHL